MAITYKRLKPGSNNHNRIERTIKILESAGISFQVSPNPSQGLLIKLDDQLLVHKSEGQVSEEFPPSFEGNYLLCDDNGNLLEFN